MKEPHWKKFELAVAGFFKERGFMVRVGKDAMSNGRSGAIHQIDVLIVDKEGKPIKAIECKWKKNGVPVQKGEIEKFITTCEDIGVKPIFVTNTRYSKGAEQLAFSRDVELYTLKDLKGTRELFESVEKWKRDLEKRDEFERFVKALEALYKSEFIKYWDIINTVYQFGRFNEIEYRRLELRDEETAKSLDLIRDVFLIMGLDKCLAPGENKLNFEWIKRIVENNPQLCENAGITLSTFENFSKSDKIKLFFEALEILGKNNYFNKSKELYSESHISGKKMTLNLELFRKNFPDIVSDRNRVRLMGEILGFPNLLEAIEGAKDLKNIEFDRYIYRNLRNIIYHELVDRYKEYKGQVDDLVNRIHFRS